MDVDTLPAVEYRATGMVINMSLVKSPQVKSFGFLLQKSWWQACLWFLFVCIDWVDLSRWYASAEKYGEGFLSVTKDMFKVWGDKLSEKVMDQNGMEQMLWILPAFLSKFSF